MIASFLNSTELKAIFKAIFADFEQSKPPFGETPWLTGHHVTPLVTLFFTITMLLTGRYIMLVVPWWFTTRATDVRERFLLSGIFLSYTPSCWFWGIPGVGCSTSKSTGLHADIRNITSVLLFVWITAIHKRVMLIGLIYGLRVADHVQNVLLTTLELFLQQVKHVRSLMLDPVGPTALWSVIN